MSGIATGISRSVSQGLLYDCSFLNTNGTFSGACAAGRDGPISVCGDLVPVSTGGGSVIPDRLKILVLTRAGVLNGEVICLDELAGEFGICGDSGI